MIKIVACTSGSDELARVVAEPVFADVCAAVTELVTTLQTQRAQRVTKVSVLEMRVPESTSFLAPHLVNIGGKIVHHQVAQVHAPAVRSVVQRQANAFGLFFTVFTTACNFHTSSTRTSTLFRGGVSRAAVQDAIEHIFLQESVAEVLVNNVVFSGRLGHPVQVNNKGIEHALRALDAGPVEQCLLLDDSTFVHSFLVRATRDEWLRAKGLHSYNMCVRVNIGRTGVVNFFIGIAGGVPLANGLESELRARCAEVLQAIVAVV